jgi:hypothetical protein
VIQIRQLFKRPAACLTSNLLETGVGANDCKCSRNQQLKLRSEALRGLAMNRNVHAYADCIMWASNPRPLSLVGEYSYLYAKSAVNLEEGTKWTSLFYPLSHFSHLYSFRIDDLNSDLDIHKYIYTFHALFPKD